MPHNFPDVTPAQIDKILAYLSIFEQPGYNLGEWDGGGYQLPYFSYRPEVDEFIDALYEQQLVIQFDWMNWQDQAQRYQTDPHLLATADLLTVRKLLTVHVRADRFVDGHLAQIFEEGHLVALLRRLQMLRDQMPVEAHY